MIINDHNLLKKTSDLVKKEKHYTHKILKHLIEIDKRRLYSDLKYPSLFKYLTRELDYSEAEAQVRIQAMRLMRGTPMVDEKIKMGELNLSQAANLQRALFQKEKESASVAKEMIIDIIEAVSGRSTRETDNILKEKLQLKRPIVTVLKIPEFLIKKLERLRKIYGEDLSDIELIDVLAEEKLKNPNNLKNAKKIYKLKEVNKAKEVNKVNRNNKDYGTNKVINAKNVKEATKLNEYNKPVTLKNKSVSSISTVGETETSRHISALVKREVWNRDNGKCQNCGSHQQVEYDHSLPFSWGGKHLASNIRLLCRPCNLRAGVKAFGKDKMFIKAKYLGS
jgi:5-methylcytosine-specific restriction endonuclease McrA